jgi:PEP-CTERM motif
MSRGRVMAVLVASASLLCGSVSGAQHVITFDDLRLSSFGGPIPNGYAGLQWENFGVLAPQDYPIDPVGYLNGMVSPRHVAFNGYANLDGSTTGGFRSEGMAFDLKSAYLTAAWNDDLQLVVSGYRRGVLKYRNTYTLDTSDPQWVAFDYQEIDRVVFLSFGGTPHTGQLGVSGTQLAVDNLVIAVPEPGAPQMLLLAAGVLGILRWRQPKRIDPGGASN